MKVRRGQNRPELRATGRTRHAAIGIDQADARLVLRRRAGRRAGAFRKDHELPPVAHLLGGAPHHRKRARPPAVRSIAIILVLMMKQAEHRNEFQLALEHEERRLEEVQERDGFPHRLMFRGDDQRALRNLLDAAKLDLDAADRRISRMLVFAHQLPTLSIAARGITKVGSATSAQNRKTT